jgi:hypothetical protein
MNHPPYENHAEEPDYTAEDPRFARSGVYVEPTYIDLSAPGIPAAPGTALPPLAPQLSEQDYAPSRYASGADVDRHIYTDEYHGPSYGELGPRPFPQ